MPSGRPQSAEPLAVSPAKWPRAWIGGGSEHPYISEELNPGTVTIELLDDVTSALSFDIARYDLKLTSPNNEKARVCGSRRRTGARRGEGVVCRPIVTGSARGAGVQGNHKAGSRYIAEH